MLGKENKHDPVLKESIGWQVREQNELQRLPSAGRKEAGKDPSASPPWAVGQGQDEKGGGGCPLCSSQVGCPSSSWRWCCGARPRSQEATP